MAAIRHLEFEFCYSGPYTKSTMWFSYLVKIWRWFDLSRRRYSNCVCQFGWKMPHHAPFFGVLGGLNPVWTP